MKTKQNPLTLEECVALARLVPNDGWSTTCQKIQTPDALKVTYRASINSHLVEVWGISLNYEYGVSVYSGKFVLGEYGYGSESADARKSVEFLFRTIERKNVGLPFEEYQEKTKLALAEARALLRSRK